MSTGRVADEWEAVHGFIQEEGTNQLAAGVGGVLTSGCGTTAAAADTRGGDGLAVGELGIPLGDMRFAKWSLVQIGMLNLYAKWKRRKR